jgi:hypothetical protein
MEAQIVWTGALETAAIKAQQRHPDPAAKPTLQPRSTLRGMVAVFCSTHPGYWSIAQIATATGMEVRQTRYVVNDMVRDRLLERESEPLYGMASKCRGQVQRYRWSQES